MVFPVVRVHRDVREQIDRRFKDEKRIVRSVMVKRKRRIAARDALFEIAGGSPLVTVTGMAVLIQTDEDAVVVFRILVQSTAPQEKRNHFRGEEALARKIGLDGLRRRVTLRQDQRRLLFRFAFGAFDAFGALGRDRCAFRWALADQLPDGVAEFQPEEPFCEIDGVTADFLVVRIPAAPVDPYLMLLPEIFVPLSSQRFPVGFQERFDVGVFCSLYLLLCVVTHGPPCGL